MNPPESTPRPRRKWPTVLTALLFGIILIGGVVLIRSSRLPQMNRERFESEQAKWAQADIANYEITVQVSGMQPGNYDVTVSNNIATAAKFNGRDLTRPRTFGTWAVSGMFYTLAQDLVTNEAHGYLQLGAEFHPDFGIPMKYQRIEMRTGAHDALQWEVTRFEPHQ